MYGSEVLIGKQRRIEDRDRVGWDSFLADKQALVEFLQTNDEAFPEIVQNAVSHIPHDKINVWPFYVVLKLEQWASQQRRVIILGDAAHAIPPSAGQGINQAFEDVYMFALLLAQADKVKMQDALSFWQSYRQQRIDKVMDLNRQIDLRRAPKASADGTPQEALEEMELGWLYEPNFEDEVNHWVTQQEVKV